MAEEFQPVEIVYLGRRLLKGGKLGAAIITTARLDALAEVAAPWDTVEFAESLFSPKGAPSILGGIYTGEGIVNDEGRITSVRFSTLKFLRKTNSPYIVTATATDRANVSRKQAALELAKAAKDSELDRILDRLAGIYAAIAPSNRQAFKVMILDRLGRR